VLDRRIPAHFCGPRGRRDLLGHLPENLPRTLPRLRHGLAEIGLEAHTLLAKLFEAPLEILVESASTRAQAFGHRALRARPQRAVEVLDEVGGLDAPARRQLPDSRRHERRCETRNEKRHPDPQHCIRRGELRMIRNLARTGHGGQVRKHRVLDGRAQDHVRRQGLGRGVDPRPQLLLIAAERFAATLPDVEERRARRALVDRHAEARSLELPPRLHNGAGDIVPLLDVAPQQRNGRSPQLGPAPVHDHETRPRRERIEQCARQLSVIAGAGESRLQPREKRASGAATAPRRLELPHHLRRLLARHVSDHPGRRKPGSAQRVASEPEILFRENGRAHFLQVAVVRGVPEDRDNRAPQPVGQAAGEHQRRPQLVDRVEGSQQEPRLLTRRHAQSFAAGQRADGVPGRGVGAQALGVRLGPRPHLDGRRLRHDLLEPIRERLRPDRMPGQERERLRLRALPGRGETGRSNGNRDCGTKRALRSHDDSFVLRKRWRGLCPEANGVPS
jgi:hypothetical protein